VEEAPARRKLNELEEELTKRDKTIRQLEEQLQDALSGKPSGESPNPGLLTELESKVVLLNQENVMMTNEKEQLRKQVVQAELALKHAGTNSQGTNGIDKFLKILPFHLPVYGWLGIILSIGLLLGFILGYRFYSNKLKKRFYGFRV
jgi:SMC interacting uncharacterized protein involved in chromosome segregation